MKSEDSETAEVGLDPVNRGQAKFLTSLHVRMHRGTFYISNTLTKLIIWA